MMKATALRLYGKNDLRLETFDLPEIKENEILADVVTNSICMSDYKAVIQGENHKRVPTDVKTNPIILGHEQCGTIIKVGEKLKDKYQYGMKYSIQPALNYPGKETEAVGYSFRYTGGYATMIIITKEVNEMDCVIPYEGEAYFHASLSEPVACIISAIKNQYHKGKEEYTHEMGIKEHGSIAVMGGAGPMGLGFLDLLIHTDKKPKNLAVTDIDDSRINRAKELFPPGEAEESGINLHFINTNENDAIKKIMELTSNKGLDDIFVLVPVPALIEQASELLANDGCLNFFAGPANKDFKAKLNFYNVHYSEHHIIGSAGSYTSDMREAMNLIGKGVINPAMMITHVGGLDSAAGAIQHLPSIPGAKKLIYTGVYLPLTALDDFEEKGKTDPLFKELSNIIKKTKGLWSKEAEDYLLTTKESIK